MNRRLSSAAAFLAGFLAVVVLGKGVNGYLFHGMKVVVPTGIFLLGLVLGGLNGLLAMGVVLIYRTNRIINFAQGELGAFAATLAVELVERFAFPYYLAVIIGLVLATATSAFIEWAIIRRFSKAPRLILTVATIGVTQILGAIELILPFLLNKDAKLSTQFKTPVSQTFSFGGIIFRGDHIAVIVATPIALGLLVWFLRGTGYGLAARAVAEDSDRARLLGVRVKRVSILVWSLAGFLSALTAILQAPVTGFQLGALGGYALLANALAAGVIARMESLPVAFGAAVVIGTAEQVIFFGTGKEGPQTGLLLLLVVVALLVQQRRIGRLESGSSSWQAIQEIRPVPTELRGLAEIRLLRWGGGVGGALLVLLLPALLQPRNVSLASVIMIYAIVGVSLVMLTGWSGNVSLGQWALVGVGALIAQKLASGDHPQDFFVVLLIASIAGAIAAVLIGLPALRIRGLFLGVTTLLFAQMCATWLFGFKQFSTSAGNPVFRPQLFGFLDTTSEKRWYYVCFAFLLLALWIARNLRRSRFGRVLISIRDNERAAQAFGVPQTREKLLAFAVSGFVAAMAGALYAYHQQQLRADRFAVDISILMFSIVVIGGMGSISGAVLGAVYVRGTQYFLPYQFQPLATGFGLLVLLLFFPGGLGQLLFGARDSFLRWVAARHNIDVPSLTADRKMDVDLASAAVSATGESHLTDEEMASHELSDHSTLVGAGGKK